MIAFLPICPKRSARDNRYNQNNRQPCQVAARAVAFGNLDKKLQFGRNIFLYATFNANGALSRQEIIGKSRLCVAQRGF